MVHVRRARAEEKCYWLATSGGVGLGGGGTGKEKRRAGLGVGFAGCWEGPSCFFTPGWGDSVSSDHLPGSKAVSSLGV